MTDVRKIPVLGAGMMGARRSIAAIGIARRPGDQ